ncbi:uncharacterized protein LOC121595910 [Anopheles merus]|uniref:uncharacterized protein LOC121595910 n=1 Tax=Anopheles merus TaxID=30066 RepID=UPI001BE48F08|nr:uncharacterized protein LOC121595910 [Anopheles merus]
MMRLILRLLNRSVPASANWTDVISFAPSRSEGVQAGGGNKTRPCQRQRVLEPLGFLTSGAIIRSHSVAFRPAGQRSYRSDRFQSMLNRPREEEKATPVDVGGKNPPTHYSGSGKIPMQERNTALGEETSTTFLPLYQPLLSMLSIGDFYRLLVAAY